MASVASQKTVSDKIAVSVGRKVLNAVLTLQGKQGISLPGIKKFLKNEKKMDVIEAAGHIKLALKKGIDKGVLVREGGNYKVKETRRRRSASKGRKGSKRRRRKRSAGATPKRRRSSRRKKGASKRKSSGKRRSRRRRSRKSAAAAVAV